MGAVYKSICFEADTLLLHANDLMEKHIALKLEIENLMNDGFVNIAKARYIMGSTCVTKMQLPTGSSNPIKPLVTVCRQEVNGSWVFSIIRDSQSKNTELHGEFSEEEMKRSEVDLDNSGSAATTKSSTFSLDRSEAAFRFVLQNDPKSLKKSKNAFLVDDECYQDYNNELLDEMSNSSSKESLESVTDPMRLFGILVPNVLKQAQVFFKAVVNLLVKCGTIQLELSDTLEKYNHLRRVKRLIEEASKEMKRDILTPKVYWTPSESTVSCYSVVPEAEEEVSEAGSISIQKSIRSVFYDEKDIQPQERDLSLWGSEITEEENNDNAQI